MDPLTLVALGVLVVVAVTSLAPRIGIAGPLLLVLLGIGVSLVPGVPQIGVAPHVVLELVLPPLLYSAAITTPAMDFRRDLRIISGLSVVLVVVSAVVVGAVLSALVPGVGLALGIAVGAVVSPTDAVATAIVRKAGLSPRVVTVLEGEAMLNDASALVLLRSAIAATAATVSLGGVAGSFALAVLVAVVVGWVVGRLNLLVRRHLPTPAASVAVSAVAPFVAAVPAEHLHGSGLVAAVAAGLVTGYGSPRDLSAQDRLAERAVWSTLGLVLEGGVFLLMGLQAARLARAVAAEHSSPWLALALGGLVATLVVALRAAFVAPSLWALGRRRRHDGNRSRITALQQALDEGTLPGTPARPGHEERDAARAATRREHLQRWIARRTADLDYLTAQRLGPREGVVLVWAGMRGAVTVAAAQTLPSDTPARALLVLVAFVVAAGTLLVQGATLPFVVRRLGLDDRPDDSADRARLRRDLLSASAARLAADDLRRPDGQAFDTEVIRQVRERLGPLQERLLETSRTGDEDTADDRDDRGARDQFQDLRRVLIEAQRAELVRQRDLGAYPSAVLDQALDQLDADQLGLDMR